MRPLLGSMGFLTTIPVGNDEKSFESFRRNLWVMPITGTIIGVVVALFYALLRAAGLQYLTVVVYILVEGINHVDGLSDFGDALFAPKDRRLKALKDERKGTGGVLLTALYVSLLTVLFSRNLNVGMIVLSQAAAKLCMLTLLTTAKPLWPGMASYMMEHARLKDLAFGLIAIALLSAYLNLITQFLILLTAICLYRYAVLRSFGGVNGDIIGASNCLIFLLGVIIAQKW